MGIIMDKHRKAFKKMRRQGIPVPTLRLFDAVTKSIKKIYNDNLDLIQKELLEKAEKYDLSKEKSIIIKDSAYNLIEYLEKIRSGLESIPVRGATITAGKIEDNENIKQLQRILKGQFESSEKTFFREFYQDGDDRVMNFLISFSLDKDKIFQSKIDRLRELYINNAVERIAGEQNELKKSFLEKVTKWVEGEEKELDVKDLIKQMKKTSAREAKFFSRDQFCRFNKSLLIASLEEAGCEYVIWRTVKDGAVRDTHRELEGKIFHIDNLPEEIDDYNCRCGLTPIWQEDYAKYGIAA
jgi:SPP1 gp7 family putative phage head morphogenesis protein